MPRTDPPFRADHVGSLLRPQRLLKAREDFAADRISADELRLKQVMLLPEPDSPTRPSVSPSATLNDTPSTALMVPQRVTR